MSDEWAELLRTAEKEWKAGRTREALQYADSAARADPRARRIAIMLRGDILLQLGDAVGALSCYETLADPAIADAEIDCARGLALFELARFPEADNALRSALRQRPDFATAHYAMALLQEVMGTGAEVTHFREARRLAPAIFPARRQMSHQEFDALLEEVIAGLPDSLRRIAQDIPVLVCELPHPNDLMSRTPPFSPRSTTAWFKSPPPSQGGARERQGSTILVYKRNVERVCADRTAMHKELRAQLVQQLPIAMRK